MGERVGMWVRVIALLTRLVDDYTTGRRPGVWVKLCAQRLESRVVVVRAGLTWWW